MRTAIDFIKDNEIIEGEYTLGKQVYPLGIQPDNSVCFVRDNKVYNGFMFLKGYAVKEIKGATCIKKAIN